MYKTYKINTLIHFTEELVVFVKRRAQHWNYFSHDLNELPNDMSSGSRELLLLLGWIMCKEGLICKFIESRTEALNEDTAYLYKVQLCYCNL